MKLCFRLVAAASLGLVPLCSIAFAAKPPATDSPAGFRLDMSYDRPGVPVPRWQLHIGQDGATTYNAEHATADARTQAAPLAFTFSHSGMLKLQQLLDDSHGLSPCETKAKGLARMGIKTLSYHRGGAAPAQCSFNYTDNKPLAAASEYLIQTSYTIEQGAALEHLHRYDRLGLDPVMTQLSEAAKQGRAPELQAIRPVLQSLAQDDQVLERVRQKAAQLLATADQP